MHGMNKKRFVSQDDCPIWQGLEDVGEEKIGCRLIAKERNRQIENEGWTLEHDDEHIYGTLAVVAASLLVNNTDAKVIDPEGRGTTTEDEDGDCWGLIKKHGDDEIKSLVIAGALVAAEIDRRIRLKVFKPDPADDSTADEVTEDCLWSHTVTEETKEIKIPREVFGVGSIVKVVSVDPADDFTAAEVGMNPRKIGGDDHEDG
jgi:hypothetical protein